MKAVLLLAHGSREGETEKTMQQITAMVRKDLGMENVEEAYLQFRDKNLEKGLDSLVAKGAKEIIVIPYFLFSGIHIQEDIPKELNTYIEKHPGIKISFGKTLGSDERLAKILADRVREML